MQGSERRLSSGAYRNQASGFTGNPLGLDTSLRSYSAGDGRKVSGGKVTLMFVTDCQACGERG